MPILIAKIKQLTEKYNDGQQNMLDGITVFYKDWHFNVRISNTESLLRLNLDAKSKTLMETKRDEILSPDQVLINEYFRFWEEIAKIDLGNVLGSVEALPDQCLDAWDKAQNISVPDSYKDIDNVIMCGMGGSGLGARVIESVYSEELKVPLTRVNGYNFGVCQ